MCHGKCPLSNLRLRHFFCKYVNQHLMIAAHYSLDFIPQKVSEEFCVSNSKLITHSNDKLFCGELNILFSKG